MNDRHAPADALDASKLLVTIPGSRASFRRRVIDATRALVRAPAAFTFLGRDDRLAYGGGTRFADGSLAPIRDSGAAKLSEAFGFDEKSVLGTTRRVYRVSELYEESERAALPYFRDHSVALRFSDALLIFLHEGGVLFGVAGLERREEDGPFVGDEIARLEQLAPFVIAGARAQLQYDGLAKEAAALRALGRVSGSLYAVDRAQKKVIWAVDRTHGIDWAEDVLPIEDALVAAAEVMLGAKARGEALPTPPRLPNGSVVAVAKIDGEPVFSTEKCAIVQVERSASPQAAALEGLSRREREIARLLVAGYSGVNVAAIAGLSENTVRTYVRRLYGKLGVSNRADLVRKLVSPDPSSRGAALSPPSQMAPPDSSLVDGDDTLD